MEQEVTNALANLDKSSFQVGGLFGMFLGMGFAAVMIGIVVYVLSTIGMWKVFNKAGEKGWKSLIPLYNSYILFKIAGRNFWKYFSIVFGAYVLNAVATSIAAGTVSTILSIGALALALWSLFEFVIFLNHLSNSFGHGKGFTVGLFFLNTIFMLILGFDSSQYRGKSE